jgi:hypothetical protein
MVFFSGASSVGLLLWRRFLLIRTPTPIISTISIRRIRTTRRHTEPSAPERHRGHDPASALALKREPCEGKSVLLPLALRPKPS